MPSASRLQVALLTRSLQLTKQELLQPLLLQLTTRLRVYGTALLFENRWCRVWDFYLEPGAGDPCDIHHHVLDYAFVYVAPGRLLGSHSDGTPGLFDSINEDGDVTWFDIPDGAAEDAAFAHGGTNGYDDRPMREYLVELK